MINVETKKYITEKLTTIVNKFNKDFADWQDNTTCRANFGWDYASNDMPKKLVIKNIDAMIYSPPEPEWVQKQKELISPKGE